MKKRYQRNHFKAFSNSVNKKKLYKKGKNWVVGSLTLLALAGLGVTANHTVHADGDANTKAATTSVGSTANIEHKAKAMYNGMIANQIANPSAGQPTQRGTTKPTSAKSNVASSSASQSSQSSSKANSVSAKTTAPSTANKTTNSAKTTTPVKPTLGGANPLAKNQPTSTSSQGSTGNSSSNSNSSVTPSASSSNGVNVKSAKSASQSASADQSPIAKAAALHNAVDKHNLNAVKPKRELGGYAPAFILKGILNNRLNAETAEMNKATDEMHNTTQTPKLQNDYNNLQSDNSAAHNFQNLYNETSSQMFYNSAFSKANAFSDDYGTFNNDLKSIPKDPLVKDAHTISQLYSIVMNNYVPAINNNEAGTPNLPENVKDVYQNFTEAVNQFKGEVQFFNHFHSEYSRDATYESLNPSYSYLAQGDVHKSEMHFNNANEIFTNQINPEYAEYTLGYSGYTLSNDSTNVTNKSNEINNLQKSASDTDLNTLSTSLTNDVNTFRAHFGNNNEGFISESEAFPRATNFQASRNLFGAAGNDYTQASAANRQVNSDYNNYQNTYSSYVGSLSKDATNFANESASISGDNQSASNASLSTFSTSFNADSTAFNNQYNAHDYKNATHTASLVNADYNNYSNAYTSYVGSLSNANTKVNNELATATNDKKDFTNAQLNNLYASASNDATNFNNNYTNKDYKNADKAKNSFNTDYANYLSTYNSYKGVTVLQTQVESLGNANNVVSHEESLINQYTSGISYSNLSSLSSTLNNESKALSTNYNSAKSDYTTLTNSLNNTVLTSANAMVTKASVVSSDFASNSSAYNKTLLSSLSNAVGSVSKDNTYATNYESLVNSMSEAYPQTQAKHGPLRTSLSGDIKAESSALSSDYTQMSNDYSSLNSQLNHNGGSETLLGAGVPTAPVETLGKDNSKTNNAKNENAPLAGKYNNYYILTRDDNQKQGTYRGFTYVYTPVDNSVEFTGGKADSNDLSNFLWNATNSDIRDANSITFDANADVSDVTSMNRMFAGSGQPNNGGYISDNPNIQHITLNGFNTSNVTDMQEMFAGLHNLKTLKLSTNFDTSHANTYAMFSNGDEEPHTHLYIPSGAIFKPDSNSSDSDGNLDVPKTIKFSDNAGIPVDGPTKINTWVSFSDMSINSTKLIYLSNSSQNGFPNLDSNQWILLNQNQQPISEYNYDVSRNSNPLTIQIRPIYDGMYYKYNSANNSIEFTGLVNGNRPGTVSDRRWNQPIINSDSDLTSMSDFIAKAPNNYIKNATSIKFDSDINFSKVSDMNHMFANDSHLKSVVFMKNNSDFRNLHNLNGMFQNDTNLQLVSLPLTASDATNGVHFSNIDMRNMFSNDGSYNGSKLRNEVQDWDLPLYSDYSARGNGLKPDSDFLRSDMFYNTHLSNTVGVDSNGTPDIHFDGNVNRLFNQPTQHVNYVDYLTNLPVPGVNGITVKDSITPFVPNDGNKGYQTVDSSDRLYSDITSDNDNKTNQYDGKDTFTIPVAPKDVVATGMWGDYRYELSDKGTLIIQGKPNTPDTDYSLPSDHHLSNDEPTEVPILQTIGDKLDPSKINNIVFQGGAVNAPSDSRQLLSGMPNLQTITNNGGYLDFTRHHTSDISYLFGGIRTNYDDPAAMMTGCADKSLNKVQGMSDWGNKKSDPEQDLSDVTNMAYAFANTGFSDLDLRNWNPGTHKAFSSGPIMQLNTYLKSDGHGGYNLASHDSDWANNTDYGINDMFSSMPNVTSIQLGDFDTSQCHRFDSLFVSDPELNYLNLGRDFHTQNAGKMYNMFTDDKSLSSDSFRDSSFKPSDFVTNKVTDMSHMFENTRFKSLNLRKWQTPSCYDMSDMFSENPQLANLDISNFDTRNKAGSTDYITGASHDNVEPNDMNLSWMFRLDYNLQNLNLGSDTFLTPNTELVGPWMTTSVSDKHSDSDKRNYNPYSLDDASYNELGDAKAKAHNGQWTRNADVVNYVLQGHKVTDPGAYKGHHKFFVGKTWGSSDDHLQNWSDVAAGYGLKDTFIPSKLNPNGIPTQYEVVPGDGYGDSQYPFKYHTGIDSDYLMDKNEDANVTIHFVDYDNHDEQIPHQPLDSDNETGHGYSPFNMSNYNNIAIPKGWILNDQSEPVSGNLSDGSTGVNQFIPGNPQHVDVQLSKLVGNKIEYFDPNHPKDPHYTWAGPTLDKGKPGEYGTKDSGLSDFVYSHVSSKDFTSTDNVPKGYYVVDSGYGEAKEQLLDPHKSGNDAQLLYKGYTWMIPVAKKAYNVTVKYFDTTTGQAVQIPGTTLNKTLDPENNNFDISSYVKNHRLSDYGYVLDGGESDNTSHGYSANDYAHSDGNSSYFNGINRGYIKTPVMYHLTRNREFDIYVKRTSSIHVHFINAVTGKSMYNGFIYAYDNKPLDASPIRFDGNTADVFSGLSVPLPNGEKGYQDYQLTGIVGSDVKSDPDHSKHPSDVLDGKIATFSDSNSHDKNGYIHEVYAMYQPEGTITITYMSPSDKFLNALSYGNALNNTPFNINEVTTPQYIEKYVLRYGNKPNKYVSDPNDYDVSKGVSTDTFPNAPKITKFINGQTQHVTVIIPRKMATDKITYTYHNQPVGQLIWRGPIDSQDNNLSDFYNNIDNYGNNTDYPGLDNNRYIVSSDEENTASDDISKHIGHNYDNFNYTIPVTRPEIDVYYVNNKGREILPMISTNGDINSRFVMPEYPDNADNQHATVINLSSSDSTKNSDLSSLSYSASTMNVYVHYAPDTANIHVYYEDADTGREISGYPESLASSATNASFNVAPYVKTINGYHFVNSMHPATSYDANNNETHTIDLIYAPNSSSATNSSAATDTVNYLISGTNSAVAPSSTDSVEFSRDVSSASGQAPSYGKWMTNSAFAPVTYNSVIISNGVRYQEVSADTAVPTPNLASDDFNANRVASFSNDIYYAPDSVTTSTQSATVNVAYDYVLYSQGGSSIASATNETVTYTRPYRFDATLNSSSVGSWAANGSFTQPASYASAGWHAVASNVAVPNVTNLQPGETSNDSYQVDYLSTSNYHTSYASSTATENINYIENNNGHDNTVSSFSKTVNLSQPTVYENDNNQQLFKGAWTFASQGDQFTTSVASLSGWTANSSNGVIPLSATGVAPGTYNKNIYYVPAKANVHVYFEAESDGHQLASQSDFTSSVNAPFSLADYENRFNNAGYHYVTALHPADSYDPSTGEVHTIDLLYAKNNQTTSNVAPENAAVTETTYDEWNHGASNVSEAASATTYHYTRNGSLVYNPATKNYSDHYSDWKLLSNSSTSNRSINLNGYYYETTVGNLPSAATLQNLAPNANVSYSDYQLYAPNSASYTNSAVSGAATETVNYYVNNSLVSSATYTSGVNLNRNALVSANNHNYVVDPGEWRVASGCGFALPASASFAGYYATSSNGNVPLNTLNVDPGNYSENVYYSPAKAHIHVYYEDADNGNNMLPNNSFSDFTSSVNAPFHMSTLGDYQAKFNNQNYHFVGEMHPANGNQFDPNNGETHTIDLLYAPNKPQVPGAKSSIHVHYIDSDDHPVTVNGRVSDNFNNRQAGTAFTMPHISDVAGYQSGNENVINPVTKFSSDNGSVTNVYVQYHKVVPGVQPITVNYISSDNTKLGSDKYTNANTTMSDIQKDINGKTFNNYTHVNTLNMPSGFTTHPQTVYVIYRPDHPVTHRGHIHVRYVDENNHDREFWSDKFSDNPGTPFDLRIDNYAVRYVPDRVFDKIISGYTPGHPINFGNQSATDPYVIVVGYAKPKPKSSASATPSSTASSASSKASSASSKASSSVSPSASSSVSSSASQPSSSASRMSSAPVIPSSQASSQSSVAPQHRSARATNNQPKLKTKQTKPVYIPKNGKGRAIRRQMIREIEKLENLIDQDIRAIQSRVVAVHKYDEHAHKQQMVHEIHIKREDLAKKEVHLRKLKAHKLPQTGESQSYSAMYAMLFVLSSVILAGLGKAIEKRRHE